MDSPVEEDDPVVKEVPVFLSKNLAENLVLLQYPVRPGSMTYNNSKVVSARIKPKQLKLEVEMGVNTAASCYNRSKGEQIALNVDGLSRGTSSTPYYNSDLMDKWLMTSTPVVTSEAQYAVGLFKDGELHLNPLQRVAQMKPSFEYLDKADNRLKQEKQEQEGGESSQDEGGGDDNATPVTVKFARPESDEARERRLSSWKYIKQNRTKETWHSLNYHSMQHPMAESERNKLFCGSTDMQPVEFRLPTKDYLRQLVPEPECEESYQPQLPNNVLSITQLKTMSLSEQVKLLLINSKVIRFSQLMSLVSSNMDSVTVLRSLQQVALLVQGNWVVKSEILHPKDSHSALTGISAEILNKGRDYVLWKFTQSRFVVRKEMAQITKLPSEDLKDILDQMSQMKVNQGWEFIHPADTSFITDHPDVVQRQNMLWENRYQQLAKSFKLGKPEATSKKKETQAAVGAKVISGDERIKQARSQARSQAKAKQQHSSAATKDSPHSTAASSQEPMDTSLPLQQRLLGNEGVAHHNHTGGPNPASADALSGELRAEIGKFIREKLSQQFVISCGQLRKLLAFRLTELPPACNAAALSAASLSDSLLESCAADVGAKLLNIPWPQDSTAEDRALFALAPSMEDNEHSKYHRVLLDMFQEKFKYRRKQISDKLMEAVGSVPGTKAEFDRLLRNCCVTQHSLWYLKGTVQQP